MAGSTAASRRSFGQIAGLQLDPTRPAITVDKVTETFRLYHERPSGLKERLYRLRRAAFTDFNALESVSFSIGHGESVAVIGHNGSGKSTLLKLLAKILPPDEGIVETNGMVASLLELGAGFHGDLTGRENIYLNGAILGLSRVAIEERFDEIVDFAGIRPLLDTAVRTYSSGLYVRLGFAIAVTVDPDILLVDEVLAVGDAEFQQRSLERMQRFRSDGKTFVLVSHDLNVVRQMCDRVLVLEQGQVAFDGHVDEGIDHYQRRHGAVAPVVEPRGREQIRLQLVELVDADDNPVAVVAPGASLTLRVCLQAIGDVETCSLGMTVSRADGTHLYELHTAWQGVGVGPLPAETEATVEFRFTANVLAGHYVVGAVVTDIDGSQTLAVVREGVRFAVASVTSGTGLVELSGAASVTEGPARRLTERQPSSLPAVRVSDAVRPRRLSARRARRGKHG